MSNAINQLSAAAVDETAREIQWQQSFEGEQATFYAASECYKCGKLSDENGTCQNDKCERFENLATDEAPFPMMNYFYALGGSSISDVEEAARAIRDLPLCIVNLTETDEWGLALTGGGMDLTWEIAEAYILLGFLPPAAFSGLPRYSGKKLTARNKRIIAACIRSNRIVQRTASGRIADLSRLRKSMQETAA